MCQASYGSKEQQTALVSYKASSDMLGPRTKMQLAALQQEAAGLLRTGGAQPAFTNWGIAASMETTYRADYVDKDLLANT
jgi:hypothetical protein